VKHFYIGTHLKKLEKKVKNKVQDATKDVLQLPILFSRRFIFYSKSTACSFRWFIVTENTVYWFVVREKHC
jgi:hypothetical protein